ncbi:MAG: hypothetical protein AM324_009150 [Candidatus Thorarchaeota archaeon SMTZ1-83]|nr:MAG: hypothetical protein AM324_10540 [Candidatus Thorarchaeota archaeon SMTZ1-83]
MILEVIMKILDRFLSVFSKRRRLLLGAVQQPDDLSSVMRHIRARMYLRITGKNLSQPSSQMTDYERSPSDISERVSRVRRITRRNA